MIGGVRVNRKDNLGKKIASKFGKFFRRHLLNDDHPDTGCGIKVFHKKLYLLFPYFDHMHRFFPALATREGALVLQHDVNHRPRSKGSSNYTNLGRLFVSIFAQNESYYIDKWNIPTQSSFRYFTKDSWNMWEDNIEKIFTPIMLAAAKEQGVQ